MMNVRARTLWCVAAAAVLAWNVAPAHAIVSFDWATVDQDLGNTVDDTGFGSVATAYRISKHETTNAQYAEFLNAKATLVAGGDTLGLYSANMGSDARGGITRTGTGTGGDPYVYSVKAGRDANPVVLVDFYDTLRFSNWLHNGQGAGDTETGAYTLLGGTAEPTNGNSITRNSGADFFLTSEDEWYKAAYYDPSTNSYFNFATSSDATPTSEAPAGGSNSANFKTSTGIFALTGSTVFDNTFNYLTDVGAYSGSFSPFGTFDQSGNAWEWNDSLISGSFRGLRGGAWSDFTQLMLASIFIVHSPTFENFNLGFRVASSVVTNAVPEPATMFLSAMAGAAVLGACKRRRA